MGKLSEKIKQNNLFTSKNFTYEEYVNQLEQLQKLICKEVFKNKYKTRLRISDAITLLKQNPIFDKEENEKIYYKGINSLKEINRELAITYSGKKAEKHVDQLLSKKVSRDDFTSYKGVYLNDGVENTEIDNLILTKNGFLLLEIKNIKSNVKITEEGRLYVNGDCSYEQTPLHKKMERKRKLFKSEIKKALKEKGFNIDIDLQTLIVFNEPKDKNYTIYNYSDEKICKSYQLANIVNKLYNKIPYSEEQLNLLRECCEEFETHKKTFKLNFEIEETIENICALIDLIEENQENEKSLKTIFKSLKNEIFKIGTGLSFIVAAVIGSTVISKKYAK